MAPANRSSGGQQEEGRHSSGARSAPAGRSAQADEQDRLLRSAGEGDHAARDALLASHLDLVSTAAKARADRGLAEGDLFQEGIVGLLEAIEGFSSSGEADFRAFARRGIAGAMDGALSDEERAVRESRMLVEAADDYVKAEVGLRATLGREGTDKELAEKLEWTVERTREIGVIVADARRRHDEELLQYLDPDEIDLDSLMEGRHNGDDG